MLSQPGKPRAVGGGMSKHLTQSLAYSNELCTLTARLTKLSKSMTLANSQNASSGGTQAPDLAAQFQLQAELGAWLPYSPTRPTNTPNPSPIRRLTERY